MKLLGINEVAQILNVNKQNIWMISNLGSFPEPVVYVGKRPAWSIDQVLDFAKGKDKTPKVNIELAKEYLNQPKIKQFPLYLLGLTEAGKLLGWSPAKVRANQYFPEPNMTVGSRSAWTVKQIETFASQQGIALKMVPNEAKKDIVIETPENIYSVVPTYTGEYLAQQEAVIKKSYSRKDGVTSSRNVIEITESKKFSSNTEALSYIFQVAFDNSHYMYVTEGFSATYEKERKLTKVNWNYKPFLVLPQTVAYEQVKTLMGRLPEDIPGWIREEFAHEKRILISLDVRTLEILSESMPFDIPISDRPCVPIAYWNEGEVETFVDDWEQAFNNIYN